MSRRNKNVQLKWYCMGQGFSESLGRVRVRVVRLYTLDHRDYWVPAMLPFSRMRLSNIKGDVVYGREKTKPQYSSPKAKLNKKPHEDPLWSTNPYQMKQLKRR